MKTPWAKSKGGMTLVEVMLGVTILAILAVLAATSLFYPRYLVVTSALEQSAIHAGSSEIEGYLRNYTNSAPNCQFNTAGWNLSVTNITTTTDIITEAAYDNCRYLHIKTSVSYRDGKTVQFETYRSLEVLGSLR